MASSNHGYQLFDEEESVPLRKGGDGNGSRSGSSGGDAVPSMPTKDTQQRGGETHIVRVIVNPSVLDRFLHGGRHGRYYFYDDIPVPYERLLVGADRPMLPSQKERLLQGGGKGGNDEEIGEDKMFGHLWMRFCARLAKAEVEFHSKKKQRFCLWGIAWSILVLFLSLVIAASTSEVETMASLLILAAANFFPMTIRFADVTESQVQCIVDDMEPLFAEEGYHVDLVTSSPMHVRFKKVPSESGGISASSLKERMGKFQEQARHDHQDDLIARRQENLRENGLVPARIWGVPVGTLERWKPTIVMLTIVFGFIFLASTAMTWLSYGYFSTRFFRGTVRAIPTEKIFPALKAEQKSSIISDKFAKKTQNYNTR
ncbi:hypothetical protein ACHAWF_010446 [Thalassiosira exigua]